MPGTGECSVGNCRTCQSEADCSEGDVCVIYNGGQARFCAPNCDNGPCPEGYFCRRNFERNGEQIDACVPNDPPGRGNSSLDVCRELNEAACAEVECDDGFVCDLATLECVELVVAPGAERQISEWGNGGENVPECGENADCTEGESCEDLPFVRPDICLMPCGADLACPDGFFCCDPFDPRLDNACVPATNDLSRACRNRP